VNALRKAIDINCQMALNPRDFLTSVVTFVFSSSGVFDALSVNASTIIKEAKAERPW
jgi:hypothetical protein